MHLPAILGTWGVPPDKAAWGALGAAAVLVAGSLGQRSAPPRKLFLAVAAFLAALLSLGYVAFYLRGGPRIVDASAYFLQARALSEGHFAWHVPGPSASFRGRFLLANGDAIAGIFPPGYPLLLSLGFAVGAPFIVGSALAAAIVVATWGLARELAREAGLSPAAQDGVARFAACLSVLCAALRYHTADTMAHGACALAFTLAILAALRGRRERLPWFFLLAGGALGFVIATRFASALALGAVLAWLGWGARARKTALFACLLGTIPGVLLLLIAQSAETGHALASAQKAYYAASDGPPGCFRYGFGAGIGCLVEHGDFVRARASSGYGLIAALGVTLRRLRMHSEDVANFEPLALLVLLPLVRKSSRTLGVRACGALVLAQVLAYAPFYFDGDYPGGGARFFADVLPVEHALVAIGVALLAWRSAAPLVLAASCAGFALHASFDHAQLRDRDGGHPMFDPEIVAGRFVSLAPKDGSPAPASLLFVETDHGFDLAHDPAVAGAAAEALDRGAKPSGRIVARLRNDDHDRLLYERLGHPPAWVYRFVPDTPKSIAEAAALHHEAPSGDLQPWSPPSAWVGGTETWRFEAESEWPPLAQTGTAWAEPIWVTDSCATPAGSGQALALHARGPHPGTGTITFALPVPRPGKWKVTPHLLLEGGAPGLAIDVLAPDGAVLAHWAPADIDGLYKPRVGKTCIDAPLRTLSVPDARELRLVVTPSDDAAHLTALDRVTLSPSSR